MQILIERLYRMACRRRELCACVVCRRAHRHRGCPAQLPGARTYVANLIGGHHLRQAFSVSQTVRVAGFEGRILELTPVTLSLETEDGRVTLPEAALRKVFLFPCRLGAATL
jgi:hypothetical protein